jgi:hypothetical protein
MDDPAMVDLAMKIANATGEDERAAAMQAFQKAIVERGQAKVEGELDPETMALLLAGPELPNDDATDAKWRRDLGERMGRLPVVATKFGDLPAWDDQQREVWSANARIVGDRLELGYLSFGRAAAGLPYLAAYLTDHGCDDIRLKLIDYDTIRVD